MLRYLSHDEWKKQYLSRFKELVSFFDHNNIEYSLAYGSMLGAVRDKKMIPWDFDIDLIIDRAEIDKLKRISSELPKGMKLKVYDKDDSMVFGIDRIYFDDLEQIYDGALFSCYVDIFESIKFDSKNTDKVIKLQNEYESIRRKIKKARINQLNLIASLRSLFVREKYKKSANLYLRKRLIEFESQSSFDSVFVLRGNGRVYLSSAKLKKISFENINCFVFEDYDNFLIPHYGANYIEPVQREEDNPSKYLFFQNNTRTSSPIIGYTTGVFDLFHKGHLNILKKAKEHCDYLIVGVSTDELVFEYKNKKPVIPFDDRAEIVKSIRYVDKVVPQTNMDKFSAWQKLKFNILFHGNDWKGSKMYTEVEQKLQDVGVEIMYFDYTKDVSSTTLREKLNK